MGLNPNSLYLPQQGVDLPARENSPVIASHFHIIFSYSKMCLVDAVTRKSRVRLTVFFSANVYSLTLRMTLHIPAVALAPDYHSTGSIHMYIVFQTAEHAMVKHECYYEPKVA